MPDTKLVVLEWGEPMRPMRVAIDNLVLSLTRPDKPSPVDRECAEHATIVPQRMHLGFYGYLRLCNARCIDLVGWSIFKVGTLDWNAAYNSRQPPYEAVDEALNRFRPTRATKAG
jgi:hypothetical protein